MVTGESIDDVEWQELPYTVLVPRLRALIERVTPDGATVAVVSKGDPELVSLTGREGWHFPRDERGRYAGHNPADGRAAIEHLELLQARGAAYIVFPVTSRWWLRHYVELADHLERHHAVAADEPGVGLIFALSARTSSRVQRDSAGPDDGERLAGLIVDLVCHTIPHGSTLAWLSATPPPAGLSASGHSVFALGPGNVKAALANLRRLTTIRPVYVVVPAAERGAVNGADGLQDHLTRHGCLMIDKQDTCTIVEIQPGKAPTTTRTRPTVLYVCHNHPSVRPGGAEAYALEIYEATRDGEMFSPVFLAKGEPPGGGLGRCHGTYFRPVGDDPNQYFIQTDGYDFDGLSGTITEKDFYTKHFRDFLCAVQPDLVHFQHTLFLGYDMIREVRATLPGVPIVYTLHEFLPICHNNGQMVRTEAAGGGLCGAATPQRCHECFPGIPSQDFATRTQSIQSHLGLVDLFLAPSEFLARRFLEWGIPRDKMRVEEYGRVLPPRSAPTEERLRRNRLGFFGQLNPYKGIDLLLEAMARLSAEGLLADPQLWVHGANLEIQKGRFQNRVRELRDMTSANVTFVGPYAHGDLPALMGEVDWVVVPSVWWENSPLVIQEAFAHRRPVICSDIGGMAEKVADGVNGIHFRAGDAGSLAGAIRTAIEDPHLWHRLREGIPEVYDMARHVRVLSKLYGELWTAAGAVRHGVVESGEEVRPSLEHTETT